MIKRLIITKEHNLSGDTLIEVLIAIAIAGFALGISYATATKSLQRAVSARERNQATNLLQSQIIALKTREQKMDKTTFDSNFVTTAVLPANFIHFCLDTSVTDTAPSGWLPYTNNKSIDNSSPLDPSLYSPNCIKTIDGADYYIDVVGRTTSTSPSVNPTVYVFNVRWPEIGTSSINQTSIYYRF